MNTANVEGQQKKSATAQTYGTMVEGTGGVSNASAHTRTTSETIKNQELVLETKWRKMAYEFFGLIQIFGVLAVACD